MRETPFDGKWELAVFFIIFPRGGPGRELLTALFEFMAIYPFSARRALKV
jgi:hypothetical protein